MPLKPGNTSPEWNHVNQHSKPGMCPLYKSNKVLNVYEWSTNRKITESMKRVPECIGNYRTITPNPVWCEIFARVYFSGLAIFCVLRELIWQIGFSCWETRIDNIFVFIKYVQQKYIFSNNTTVSVPYIHVYKTSISLYNVLILKERNKLYLNRHYFLVL